MFTYNFFLSNPKGQERFQSLSKLFLKNTNGCIIVTDATNKDSLYDALEWKKKVEENLTTSESVPIALVQNKIDLLPFLEEKENFMIEENFK